MHILKVLDDIHQASGEARQQMAGPKDTEHALRAFEDHFSKTMAALFTHRSNKKNYDQHPLIEPIQHWFDLRILPLLTPSSDLKHWNEAHQAVEWVRNNSSAVTELLRVWGGMTESHDDATPTIFTRYPVESDAPPGGGGRIPEIWNDTSIAFRTRKNPIQMGPWNEATLRPLFLTKSGRPSYRASVTTDLDNNMRGFYVYEKTNTELLVNHIGTVSKVQSTVKDTLALARALLEAANLEDEHSSPLLIRLRMPRPSA